jgi:formamidopyrimidine-DNA glycosylase
LPELPEVETVCRGLNQVTLHHVIQGGDVLLERTIAHPIFASDFLAGLTGCAIAQWQRRGKYLLASLTRPDGASPAQSAPRQPSAGWLGVHLRMTGQLLWLPRDTPLHRHTRVRLWFDHGQELRFVDQRTFGRMWWIAASEDPAIAMGGLSQLGPEPFSPEFSVGYLAKALQGSRRPIKSALLDQSLVAGVGNIYADESLFLSQIHPQTPSDKLTLEQLTALRLAVIQVLESSIQAGGTTFSNFLNVQGINGNYGGTAWVYNRKGEPCRRCQTAIARVKLSGRSTHFCPHCQSSTDNSRPLNLL